MQSKGQCDSGSCFSKVPPLEGPAQTWPIKATSAPSSSIRDDNASVLGTRADSGWWLLQELSVRVQQNYIIQIWGGDKTRNKTTLSVVKDRKKNVPALKNKQHTCNTPTHPTHQRSGDR